MVAHNHNPVTWEGEIGLLFEASLSKKGEPISKASRTRWCTREVEVGRSQSGLKIQDPM
jgi:hypothetical protein